MEENLRYKIIEALKQVHDPEIPVNIYDLGLIYEIEIDQDNNVKILMTFTSPSCPASEHIFNAVESNIKAIPEVDQVQIDITFSPPYSTELMSESAKLELGFL
jgi:FeS assembly SUF system protein